MSYIPTLVKYTQLCLDIDRNHLHQEYFESLDRILRLWRKFTHNQHFQLCTSLRTDLKTIILRHSDRFSSEISLQSGCWSHFFSIGMQRPSWHLNCVLEQVQLASSDSSPGHSLIELHRLDSGIHLLEDTHLKNPSLHCRVEQYLTSSSEESGQCGIPELKTRIISLPIA